MRQVRKTAWTLLTIVALAVVTEFGVFSKIDAGAEARVGRPLTPVSVAGAGRRTVRRCAAGVYNC